MNKKLIPVSASLSTYTHSYKTQARTGNLSCTEDRVPVRQSKENSDTEQRSETGEIKENLALPLVDQPLLGLDPEKHLVHLQAVSHAEAEP